MLRKMLLTGIVMGCICSVAFGAEESNNRSPDIGFEVRQGKLVLDEKGDDYVMCCMRRLDITSYTLIKNERGMIISLDEIDIPCEAMVSYYKKPGKKHRFVVVSMEVKGKPQPLPE
jgi:hypothetical protein